MEAFAYHSFFLRARRYCATVFFNLTFARFVDFNQYKHIFSAFRSRAFIVFLRFYR